MLASLERLMHWAAEGKIVIGKKEFSEIRVSA